MPRTKPSKPDRLKEAHERLTAAVSSIVSGDDWQRMLKTAAKFHRYSLSNILLIQLQKADATMVAGFRRWKELGRTVRKGERGIQIIAPCRYRTKVEKQNGDEEAIESIRGWKVVYVFDISQTEGEPLEDLDAIRPKLLDGDAPEGIWDALVTQADAAGFEVVRDQKRNENGYCDFLSKKISVRPDVAPAQAVKTLVHELSHALLHGDELGRSREIQEVEVESVAFVVLDALGLQSGDYSFPYVARWTNGDVDVVKRSADRAISCARTILAGMEASSVLAAEVAAPSA
jgi:antirestriction protein ArdC